MRAYCSSRPWAAATRPPRRAEPRSSLAPEVLGRELPVRELVEHRIHMVAAPILVIEIVGVLPYVDGQQGLRGSGQRRIGVGGFQDLELLAVPYQPGPAAAELPDCGGGQFLLARCHAAEGGFHEAFECSRRLAAAARFQAFPIKSVIPGLRRVVE